MVMRMVCRMVHHPPGGPFLQRGAEPVGQRHLGQRPRVDQHVHRFPAVTITRPSLFSPAAMRNSVPTVKEVVPRRVDAIDSCENLVEARRRLPFDRLLDELEIEMPVEEIGAGRQSPGGTR